CLLPSYKRDKLSDYWPCFFTRNQRSSRYQQIHILGSLTPNPNVTSFVNKIASTSASFLSLGFLVYFFLFLFKEFTVVPTMPCELELPFTNYYGNIWNRGLIFTT
ncbi:DNA damage-regulated autophagy modulator protein 1, partial [Operophtera brumata]